MLPNTFTKRNFVPMTQQFNCVTTDIEKLRFEMLHFRCDFPCNQNSTGTKVPQFHLIQVEYEHSSNV